MFKAFYLMFQNEQTKKTFIKNCINLFLVFLIIIGLFLLMMYLIFSESVYGLLFVFIAPLMIIPTLLSMGYFWKMVENIIDRRTDIVSSSIYGGKVNLIESIEIPNIKFFSYIWKGFAGSVAVLIMEIPVFVLLLYCLIYKNEQFIPAVIAVQVLIWILSPGLYWNYAKENSIFSILNVYVAGHLFENKPGRYIWNALLSIISWGICIAIAYFLEFIIGVPSSINSVFDAVKTVIPTLILFVPYLYVLHVHAFLIGTLGNSNDF